MKYFFKKDFGAAALSTILLIGGIVVETAVASLLASYLVSQEGLGLKLSNTSTLIARAGINDAIIKIVRDKDYIAGSPYTITMGTWSTTVMICDELTVSASSCVPPTLSNRYDIVSTASVLNKQSKIRAIVSVNNITGQTTIESVSDVSN